MVVHQILGMFASEKNYGTEDASLDGDTVLRRATQDSTWSAHGKRLKEFQLKLSEAVAIQYLNFDVLERAVLSLYKKGNTPDLFRRAASIIEGFCSSVGETKNELDPGSPGLHLKDEKLMVKVLSLVERLASGLPNEMPGSYAMCLSFARICTSFENCDNLLQMRLVAKYLLRHILSSSHRLAEIGVRALKRDLGSVVGRVGSEQRSIALMLFTSFSEHGKLSWLSNGVEAIDGRGNPSSPTLAVQLFSVGMFEENNAECLSKLGSLYACGYQSNSVEPVKANELFSLAVQGKKHVPAMYNLARFLEKGMYEVKPDPVQSVKLYSRAIEPGGNVKSMLNLGLMLKNGADGVKPDLVRAVQLYRRAINDTGNVEAIDRLGTILEKEGVGVAADPERAVDLYSRAVREGNIASMNNFGTLLVHGAGCVNADPVRAAELSSRAVDGGRVTAMYNLGRLFENGAEGVEVDCVRAVQLYSRGVDEGEELDALRNLAYLLWFGADGVALDPSRAVELYSLAIDKWGDVKTMNSLATLLLDGITWDTAWMSIM